ncbi:hypothetical protein EV426DRAFT_87434 [Tirmania nivea]|nr:hypothetical protein EV426DRAFT_87434 [Tirmania nivea]
MHQIGFQGNRCVCACWKPNPGTPRKSNGLPRIILIAIVLERSRGEGTLQNNQKKYGGDRNRLINCDCREHPGSSCRAAVTVKVSSMLSDAWLISGPTVPFILLRHSQSRSTPYTPPYTASSARSSSHLQCCIGRWLFFVLVSVGSSEVRGPCTALSTSEHLIKAEPGPIYLASRQAHKSRSLISYDTNHRRPRANGRPRSWKPPIYAHSFSVAPRTRDLAPPSSKLLLCYRAQKDI